MLIGLNTAWPSVAQETTITALTKQSCAGTRSATNLLCTANDFTASATFTQPSASAIAACRAGETLSLDVIATITSQQAQRYDVGIFLGEHGNAPNLNDATATCSLGVFPTSPDPPYYNDDGDVCGDYRKASTSNLTIHDVNVKCLPAPGTNYLGVPYLVAFDNQPSGNTCSPATITAGTASKCTMGIGPDQATVVDLTVKGYVTISKQTSPAGADDTFSFTASGSAEATPTSFSLADTESETVEIPLSATGGDQILTITEVQRDGWGPNATIVCTDPLGGPAPYVSVDPANRSLTATLNASHYGAHCSITNVRRQPLLTILKFTDKASAQPGDTIAYTVRVVNGSGSDPASGIVVRDSMSPFLSLNTDPFGNGTPFRFTEGIPASGVVPDMAHFTLAPNGAWQLPMSGSMAEGGIFILEYQATVK